MGWFGFDDAQRHNQVIEHDTASFGSLQGLGVGPIGRA
jgi:hypothetical protein